MKHYTQTKETRHVAAVFFKYLRKQYVITSTSKYPDTLFLYSKKTNNILTCICINMLIEAKRDINIFIDQCLYGMTTTPLKDIIFFMDAIEKAKEQLRKEGLYVD